MKRLCIVLVLTFLWFSASVANAATALLVGGAGKYATLTDEQMAAALGGYFANDTRVNVPFPGTDDMGYSIKVGTDNLYEAVYATPGPKIIGGVSEGAPVVSEVLRRLATDPNPPPKEELSAMVYGDPSRLWFSWGSTVAGYTYQPPPETQYDVIVVMAEYDGIADWPDNWSNLLAVVNAYMGIDQVHVDSGYLPLPEQYISKTTNSKGGTTTTYLIPTPVLPLLKPLVDQGVDPSVVSTLDAFLRPIIDSAYLRTYFPPSPVQATASSARISASNVPPTVEATTLKLAGPPQKTAVNQADLGITQADDAASNVRASSGPTITSTANIGHANAAPGAVPEAAHELAADNDPGTPTGSVTTHQPTTKSPRTSLVDMTNGNKVKPGETTPTNPTKPATDAPKDAQEPVTEQTNQVGDGPANANDQANKASPGDTNTRAESNDSA